MKQQVLIVGCTWPQEQHLRALILAQDPHAEILVTRTGPLAIGYLERTIADDSCFPSLLLLVLDDYLGPGFEVLNWVERQTRREPPAVIAVAEKLSEHDLDRLLRSPVLSAFAAGPIDWPALARTVAEHLPYHSTGPAGDAPLLPSPAE